MIVNLGLAGILAGITAFTDLKAMKIYNKHVFPFAAIGVILAIYQGRYDLILSGLMVFGIYLFFYAGGRFLSKILMAVGGVPIPAGQKPMGGGDVKLAATLAFFVGHMPVLYGTIMACFMIILYVGIRAWINTGSIMAFAYTATAKLPSKPAPMGVLLGPCTVLIAMALYLL